MKPNETVDAAIEKLAANFCKIGQGAEHKALYLMALHSLARMVRSDVLMRVDADLNQAKLAMTYGPTK